jgi:hypothetical protein
MGVRWQDGRLAAATLFAALEACGIDPAACDYVNLFHQYGPKLPRAAVVMFLHRQVRDGWVVVGLGRAVQRQLRACQIPHLALVHPAARGAIRGKACYQRHVAEVLGHLRGKEPR